MVTHTWGNFLIFYIGPTGMADNRFIAAIGSFKFGRIENSAPVDKKNLQFICTDFASKHCHSNCRYFLSW